LLIGDLSLVRHDGGCLPGYADYDHIITGITTKRFHEKPHGILTKSDNIVNEIWIGPRATPSWTIVQRDLQSDCARVLDAGVGYYFDMDSSIEGLPL
jgi:hypothetical protein